MSQTDQLDPNLRPLFFFVKLKKDEKMKKSQKKANLLGNRKEIEKNWV